MNAAADGYLAFGWLTMGQVLSAPMAVAGLILFAAGLSQSKVRETHPRMRQYLDLLQTVRVRGVPKADRTGTGTVSIFGYQLRCDLADGFPLLTTKKLHLRSIIHELLWFLSGDTNIGYLTDNGVSIWNEWADESGDLGPVYGAQWRAWPAARGETIDQIQRAVELIRSDPDSRRILVSAWNVGELHRMALAPCHALFQFYVAGGKLSCQLYQRSADVFLGVPFNIACYALLTRMMAQQTNLQPGEFVWTGGDCHLYLNHFAQADEQLARAPRALPALVIKRRPASIFDYRYEDFELVDYRAHAPRSRRRRPIPRRRTGCRWVRRGGPGAGR